MIRSTARDSINLPIDKTINSFVHNTKYMNICTHKYITHDLMTHMVDFITTEGKNKRNNLNRF